MAYGYDTGMKGYFLAVTDSRLKYCPKASKEVNSVCENIGVLDGGGSYFDLNTYEFGGFGQKVSVPVIVEFMRRYGVPEKHLKMVKKCEPI